MKKNLTIAFLLTLVFSIGSFAQKNAKPTALRAMYIYIGGTLGGSMEIKGESVDALSPNAIDVLAYSEGISSPGCINNNCPVPNQQDLSFTIYQTKNFPILRQALITHAVLNMELTVINGALETSKIYLEDAFISSISSGGSGGEDRLTANISVSAKKWFYSYKPSAREATISHGWNFETNTAFTH